MYSLIDHKQAVLVDAGLGADRVDRRFAVARAAAVHHREHAVGPVVVGRAAVAVRHRGEAGHLRADLVELVLGYGPHAHRVRLESGAAVVHHRGEAAHQLAFLERAQRRRARRPRSTPMPICSRVRPRTAARRSARSCCTTRIVASSRSERSGAGISALRSGRSCSSTSAFAFGRGLAGHVELHADLVQRDRRQRARDARTRLAVQHVDVLVEGVARRDRDRVPEVVVVVALVVVAHAGVFADHRGGFVDVVGVDLRRDERRRVAERTRVEDRRQLAQHAVLLHLRDAGPHRRFVDAEAFGEDRERPGVEREVPLDRVQQLAVEVVQPSSCATSSVTGRLLTSSTPMLARTARGLRFRRRPPDGRSARRGAELDPHLHHVVPRRTPIATV